MQRLFAAVQFVMFLVSSYCSSYTPVVLWHGMTDSCCNNTLTGRLQRKLMTYLPGVYVVSLEIGSSETEDYINSILMHPDKQIEEACKIIKEDPLLANGYNAIGYSQGAQLMRGLVQRCPEPKMKNLVSLAGQQQGIYGTPNCDKFKTVCNIVRNLSDVIVYLKFLQMFFSLSTYWHNPLDKAAYIQSSTFLADINNEKFINRSYIENLQTLERFIMIKNEFDETIIPLESEWFGFFKPGQSEVVETLRESELYTSVSERLGLKQMDIEGKLVFLLAPWIHQQFDWHWFKNNIVDKYLV